MGELRTAAARAIAGDETSEVRKVASSVLAAFDRGSDARWFDGARYRLVGLPLTRDAAAAFAEAAGGELALPGDAVEAGWMRRKFLDPARALPIWWGGGEAGKASLATAWPVAEIEVPATEQHPFVVRWRREHGAGSVAGDAPMP